MYKNVAGQKVGIYAWDGANGVAKTGDAGNITAQVSKDGGASAASNDTNPTELDAVDHPGVYIFDLLQAETNCDLFILTPVSSTTDINFRPTIKDTELITPTKAGYIDQAISTVDTVADGIQTDLDNATDGLGALKALIDGLNNISIAQVNTEVDNALNTTIPAAPTVDSINEYIQILKYVLINKIVITEATGNTKVYKDNDVTEHCSVAGAFDSDGVDTTRKRLE